MASDGATGMQPALRFEVGGVGGFGGGEGAEVVFLAECHDRGLECSVARCFNAEESAQAIPGASLDVLDVDSGSNVSEVFKYIVCADSIDVVDVVSWPFACHVEQRNSVCPIMAALNAQSPIVARNPSRHITDVNAIARLHQPREHSRAWIVVQKFAQPRSSERMGSSHDASVSQSGQRPRVVNSGYGASSLYGRL